MSDGRHFDSKQSLNGFSVMRLGQAIKSMQLGTSMLGSESGDGLPLLKMGNLTIGGFNFGKLEYLRHQDSRLSAPYSLRRGDFLFNTRNTLDLVGKSAVWRQQLPYALFNSNIMRIKFHDWCDDFFLGYYFATHIGWREFRRIATGTTSVAAIYSRDLVNCTITLPPIAQQRKIAQILTTVDNLIEKTESLIAKYQAIKQGMMHDLFTRGIDAHGHLRPPQTEAPDLYKQSELGWIPKEWDLVPAKQLCHEITKGSTPSDISAEYGPGRVPFIRVQNLSFDGTLLFESQQAYILTSVHDTALVRSKVFPGDVLMNLVGPPMGKISLVPDTYPEWNINQAISIFRTLDAKSAYFLSHYLLSKGAYRWFLSRAKKTSGQQNLTLEMSRQVPVPKPQNRNEQDRITARLRSADEMLASETLSLNKLKHLKKGLMQDLLTGNVRVKVNKSEEVAS